MRSSRLRLNSAVILLRLLVDQVYFDVRFGLVVESLMLEVARVDIVVQFVADAFE